MVGYMAQALLRREIIMKTKQKKLGGLGLAALLFVALPRMLYAYEEIVVRRSDHSRHRESRR